MYTFLVRKIANNFFDKSNIIMFNFDLGFSKCFMAT